MGKPWLRNNPLMSLWLSAADRVVKKAPKRKR